MAYTQVFLELDAEDTQAAEDLLMESGALAVTLRDPGGEPVLEPAPGDVPLWPSLTLCALFPDGMDLVALRRQAALALGETTIASWRQETLQDRVWERVWMDDFTPMRFGRRLWICPSTHQVDATDAVVVKLDPGLAFGTGTHPTTALCLRWLDAQDLRGQSVIDLGCGSGVLGVAALLLGAGRCVGIDNDPQALIASRDNAIRNDVSARLRLLDAGDPDPEPADVLVANILSSILIRLQPQAARLLRPGGRLALSGILDTQVDAVTEAYAGSFALDPPQQDGDWMLLSGRKR
ncbi:50S ribosomal protein L11 methyltransferase [Methylonatrum kenyense]|uniref:50S ribosomal protein L11 methyltransferase n=1 Tax=Methylonatrum kenyense TaxID=455253 RepID=UPI00202B0564|nr:50S ribosomal protein L11 methyltransferase [Methylonatrum kenyense]MCK8516143.1 50S ribosomal protein L11 methyltransferase [Methylonatrum kenyense]